MNLLALCYVAACAGLVYLWLALAARSVAIDVSPRFAFAPAAVRVRVTVDPKPDQRLVRVQADSGVNLRASEYELHGEDGPRTTWIDWRDLPAGDYVVTADVATSTDWVAQARTTVQVLE